MGIVATVIWIVKLGLHNWNGSPGFTCLYHVGAPFPHQSFSQTTPMHKKELKSLTLAEQTLESAE